MAEGERFTQGEPMFPSQRVSAVRLAALEAFSDGDVQDLCADVRNLHRLAERLMGDVADLLSAYKTMTYNHPDDGIRILTIGHMEADIVSARWCLYGQTTDGVVPSGV